MSIANQRRDGRATLIKRHAAKTQTGTRLDHIASNVFDVAFTVLDPNETTGWHDGEHRQQVLREADLAVRDLQLAAKGADATAELLRSGPGRPLML